MSAAPLALRLAFRELRGGLKGFRIFLACLALGVGAIAAIGSTAEAIRAGLDADGRTLLGGDVAIRLIHREIDPEAARWLAGQGELSRSVGMRAMARAAAGPADAQSRTLIELKAVDSRYPLYGKVRLAPAGPLAAALAFRHGVWGAVVEDRLLRRLGLAVGARIRIGEADFEVRAVLEQEPDRLSAGGLVGLGPRVMVSTASLPATRLILPGSLVNYTYKIRLPAKVDLAAWRAALDARYPDAVWRVRDRTNASPAAQRFLERTSVFMTLIGLTALLVGGVGVGNAVGHYLGGRTATIATLKCLGASSGLIFRVYLAQILTMALVGIAAGLVLGAAAPLLARGTIGEALAVSARIGLYPGVLGLAAAYGLLTALVFSIWPIGHACRVPGAALFRDLVAPSRALPRPVYVAATAAGAVVLAGLVLLTTPDRWLAAWFIAGAAAAFVVFRLAGLAIERLAGSAHGVSGATLRLALANLHRPGAPTAKVVLSLGLGLTILVAIASVEGNLRREIDQSLAVKAPDFYFIDLQPDQVAGFEQTVLGVDRASVLHRTPMLRGRITAINGKPVDAAHVRPEARWMLRGDRGITWSARPPAGSTLVAGRWWAPDYAGPPLVSLSAEAARGFGIGLGDTLTVNVLGREITARIASLREINWRSLRINFVMVFSPGVLEGAPRTELATVRADPADLDRIETAVTDRFANVTAIRVREVLATVERLLGQIAAAGRVAAGITLAAGTLVLAGAAAAGHRRRVYDSVVLKVLGATRLRVLGCYAIEYGLLGLATAAIAAALGTLAAWAVVRFVMSIDWVFQPGIVLATAAGSAALTLALGFAGTWRALGQRASPVLRNE